ncbi:MAG: response regulator transcription factor [Chloroflexi bacterium]|jgi:two-component system, OmpR family, KDP operon response regulator KdpE|nr:response regulator transcription factor [Chloroflexota bacterium]MBT3670370.1 response regulator transcription factor [Chloroflexota bacterium]MBT4002055.1 response regulator transcription factor [Chloroflexota bacterium]MBT4305557.1 response regulator transcription factor [Chloroflexota bacterium]MBT4533169.1 response regulator transcription factor [Chloroflexota bacterium]
MSNNRVLIVDDEDSLLRFMKRNLEVRNFKVHSASNGLEALAIFEKESIDLIILDVMMPHMDGLETLSRIREYSKVPIVVLSALGEEQDKVKALNLGADDYLTKPFGVDELLARVHAVIRRSSWVEFANAQGQVVQGDLVADLDRHEIQVRGEVVDFTPTEFNLLVFFMRNTNRLLTHERILKAVWGPEYGQEAEYLRVYIGRLRQKIEVDPIKPRYLRTERGVGYIYDGGTS